jgi:predicted metal-binding membrane protein
LLNHDYLINSGRLPWLAALGLFLVSWQIMMVPSTSSVLSLMILASDQRRLLWLRQILFLLGYGLVWTLFALLGFVGDTLLHQLVNHWWWLYQHAWLIGSVLFMLAGAMQFSPLKRYCLTRCCDAAGGCAQHTGVVRTAWWLGWRYGLSTAWARAGH